MSDFPELLSTRQAASILGVTTRTIHRWADAGYLVPTYQIDGLRGSMIFRESDVTDLAARRRGESAA